MEIDQFQLKEGREEQGEPVIQVLDSEDELDRFSGVRTFGLVVALIASDSEEEEEKEEEIPLERKKGLRELLVGKAKGSAPKDASGSHLSLALPPPPSPSVNPFALANLKKRKIRRWSRRESWSLIMRRFLQSFQGWPGTREGLPRSRPRKVGTWPWNSIIREF